jgi:hypothetical protein
MSKDENEVERFYQAVADLLGVPSNYQYNPHTLGGTYRTRWNNRGAGNGRFEGYGLIRYFGPNDIHVMLRKPLVINQRFSDPEAVLDLLRTTPRS